MTVLTTLQRRPVRRALFFFGACVILGILLRYWFPSTQPAPYIGDASNRAFVVSSLKRDDVSWLTDNLHNWQIVRYVVDDADAQYTVPMNKGREAMVYLTYVFSSHDDTRSG